MIHVHDTQSAQTSKKQDERNIYVIMKTMCPPGYHHNGFVVITGRAHCFHDYIYIYIYIYIEMFGYVALLSINFVFKNHTERPCSPLNNIFQCQQNFY